MLNGLDLFSGIGGLSLALRDYVRTVAYCEIESYCQAVLLSRMADGNVEYAPVWDDIRSFRGGYLHETIDIITAGFPCQDISIAGLGKGLEGERSGLFFEIMRLAAEIKPRFVFLENVPAIISRGANQVLTSITEMGYDCRWCVISAESVGAPHKRERWFLLAHSNSEPSDEAYSSPESVESSKEAWLRSTRQDRGNVPPVYWDENKCPSFAMDDGFPYELDQSRALGNAVVPQQCKKAFEILMGIDKI